MLGVLDGLVRRRKIVGLLKSLFAKKEEPAPGPAPAMEAPSEVAVSGAEPIHVTDETFEELVLNSQLPVLVDFWAPWCGPCRMVAPIVEELAQAYESRALIAKINTDENVRVATELGIMGIPTLILFRGGQEVDRMIGFAPRNALESKLKAVLS
jgi:thioredoxin 1